MKRILVVRNDRLGEFLLTIPAFNALKEYYADAQISVVVNPYLSELATAVDSLDTIFCWKNKKHTLRQIITFSRQLRKEKFDLCVIFNPTKEFNIISFLAGIPIRVGYKRKWPFLLTHTMLDKKDRALKHEVESNLELLKSLDIISYKQEFSLQTSDTCLKDILAPLDLHESDILIGLHPWTSDVVKAWPLENFQELSRLLLGRAHTKVVILGGKEEANRSSQAFHNSAALIDLTGKTSLLQLAALIKRCNILVSADSGPVHVAACTKTATIALFRNDLNGKTALRWGPKAPKSKVLEAADLSRIQPATVLQEIERIVSP
ncbi:MAG TPA: glycosyltransferase family 9 protein [Candidatus Omnitrophota bacterium]|nr:glycosyltransferase family 9 protein [Candidatus Omnitrophota bacterium]HPT07773.1 glycosyltransferase family 9 protein [Candidatus Omnitrophota bacterium]